MKNLINKLFSKKSKKRFNKKSQDHTKPNQETDIFIKEKELCSYNEKHVFITLPCNILKKIVLHAYFMDARSPLALNCTSRYLIKTSLFIKQRHVDALISIRDNVMKLTKTNFAIHPYKEEIIHDIMQTKKAHHIYNNISETATDKKLNLSNLDLSHLDLSGLVAHVSFIHSNLIGCKLDHAYVGGADFSEANTKGLDLSNLQIKVKIKIYSGCEMTAPYRVIKVNIKQQSTIQQLKQVIESLYDENDAYKLLASNQTLFLTHTKGHKQYLNDHATLLDWDIRHGTTIGVVPKL